MSERPESRSKTVFFMFTMENLKVNGLSVGLESEPSKNVASAFYVLTGAIQSLIVYTFQYVLF